MRKYNFTQNVGYKCWLTVISFLFISISAYSQVYPMDTLMRNGERPNRINMAYLGDGYTSGQLSTFVTDATNINTALFGQAPFQQYKNFFNSYAIKVSSTESGAKHPATASDEGTSGGQPVANPNNAYGSTFDYFSIHRLLVPINTIAINGALASNLPDYTQAFIVVNSPYYGGSGGTLATASTEANSAEVAIHEIGHSFGGLADEYWAGAAYAAEKPNLTANSNPATNKWKNWIGINSIDIYPHAESPSWFRPHQTCKMRYLNFPFCSVCSERLIDVIQTKVNMIDIYTPTSTSFTLANTNDVNFSVTAVQTTPSTIGIKWYLNGSSTPFATNQYSVTVPFANLNNGNNTVRAEVIDNTSLSKSYLPGVGYINNLTWTVNKPASLPIRLLSFNGKVINQVGNLKWEIDSPDDLETFILEKSRNSREFVQLANISPIANVKSYVYDDERMFIPDSYYRLKMIEKDGTFKYSNTLRLQSAFEKYFYKVYQDPDARKYHLTVGITEAERISYTITDIQGRIIERKNFGMVSSQLEHDFDLSGKAAGVYFMRLNFGTYQYSIKMLAK